MAHVNFNTGTYTGSYSTTEAVTSAQSVICFNGTDSPISFTLDHDSDTHTDFSGNLNPGEGFVHTPGVAGTITFSGSTYGHTEVVARRVNDSAPAGASTNNAVIICRVY